MSVTPRNTRVLLAVGGALLVAIAVSGCGTADASDAPVEKRSFAFSGKTLTVNAGNSSVRLVPADVRAVEVTRQVDGWVLLGSGPDASWKMTGDTLTLKLKCEALASNCRAEHQIRVPRGVAVTVEGDNGNVTASGFSTALKIDSDNGSVLVKDSSGRLDLDSDNGDITGQRISATQVTASSDNGSVRLGLVAVPDTVDADAGNGDVLIDLPRSETSYAVTVKGDDHDDHVDVPVDDKSAHVVKARSDNGKVTVRSAN